MANPLKILSDLQVSGSAVFKSGADMNSQKITGLAAGTANGDAIRYEQHSTEVSRAQSAEASLSTGVSAEASRAGSAEASLSTGLSSEISRAGSAETSLSTGLSAEISRAGSAEVSLSTGISSEASRAASAEAVLSTGISTEMSRAQSVETSLSTGLSSEASRAASAEASVSAAASTAVSAEASRAGSVEASLSTGLSAEVSRAGSAEVSLSTGISAEASRAGSAEASLSTGLSAEASRAASAEASVSAAASTAISAEASRAGSAEASLSTGLSTEVSRAGSAEASLSTGLSTEVSRASSVEVSLSTGLSTEVSRAGSAEASLSTGLSTEVSRATSAEASLSTADLDFLKLDGTRAMTGELKMGNQNIVNANNGTFNGNLLVKGDLNVSGALTYINTTNLDINDAKVTIAKGAADLAAAADAGLYVGSDTSPLGKVKVGSDGSWLVSGSKGLDVSLTGSVSDLFASGTDAGGFSVEGTFRNVQSNFQNFQTFVQGLKNVYNNARYVLDTFAANKPLNGSGYRAFILNEGNASFAAGEIANISVDVMVKDGSNWTNDLVSAVLVANGSDIELQVTAPAAANGHVRIIAVNEKKTM